MMTMTGEALLRAPPAIGLAFPTSADISILSSRYECVWAIRKGINYLTDDIPPVLYIIQQRYRRYRGVIFMDRCGVIFTSSEGFFIEEK